MRKINKLKRFLHFFLGFLAKKFKREYPHLGDKTCEFDHIGALHSGCPWLFSLSNGGLMVPTPEFLSLVKKCETEFKNFHGKEISREDRIIDKMTSILETKFGSEVNKKVLYQFAKSRTSIRIKYLNYKLGKTIDVRSQKQKKQFKK